MLEQARLFHHNCFETKYGPAVGASEDEVAELERALGCTFPAAYREFLLWMGRDYAGVFQGSDCFIDQIEANRNALMWLLSEWGIPPPPNTAIPFISHQGYSFLWFLPDAAQPDPEVWGFSEAYEPMAIRAIGRFSEWLLSEFKALVGG